MSKLLDNLMERAGVERDDVKPWSRLGKLFRRKGVRDTPELQRVLALPRRNWQDFDDDAANLITEWLKRPGGQMKLRTLQAAALADIHDYEGMFGPIRVGAGKTLITFLAARVLGAERPVLLIPAKLRRKTRIEMDELAKHWLFPRPTLVSYELLGRAHAADKLAEIQPDLICADECHKLKNTSAAVTRRVARFIKAHPEVVFIPMSGTVTRRSLWDYAHLLEWSVPSALYPLPRDFTQMAEWADALDEKRDANRMAAGGLRLFMNREESNITELQGARMAYRRRLTDTPAVIATEDKADGMSLIITGEKLDLPDNVDEAFQHLRSKWQTPDGWDVAEAVEIWRHCRELACGFYYVWDPRPPMDWMMARSSFYKDVRHILRYNQRNLDSMLQVVNAMDAGHYDASTLGEWRAIRDTFKPNTVPIWLTDVVVDRVVRWMKKPGIVWVEHIAFADKLIERGLPVYGRGGENQHGSPIELADPSKGIVASIAANSEGRNLQAWSRNLVVSCPGNGGLWEQLLGRTHRDGQESDEVTFELLFGCLEQWSALQQALADSRYIQDSTGQEQKLLYADIDVLTPTDVVSMTGPRWNK